MTKMDIIFEDDWILVVNKPAGVVVNRSQTSSGETLQDQLSEYFKLGNDLGIGDRAGIVHRLDRETSGLLVVAKTLDAFENLQSQFKDREVNKKYLTLVHGRFSQKEGFVEARIRRIGKFGRFGVAQKRDVEGKEARTDFVVDGEYTVSDKILENSFEGLSKGRARYLVANAKDYSFLSVFPKSGRTHQIRVHLKSIGHPVVSDMIYGPGKLLKFDMSWCARLFLHAAAISFEHPHNKKEVKFEVDLPKDLKDAMLNLTKI